MDKKQKLEIMALFGDESILAVSKDMKHTIIVVNNDVFGQTCNHISPNHVEHLLTGRSPCDLAWILRDGISDAQIAAVMKHLVLDKASVMIPFASIGEAAS